MTDMGRTAATIAADREDEIGIAATEGTPLRLKIEEWCRHTRRNFVWNDMYYHADYRLQFNFAVWQMYRRPSRAWHVYTKHSIKRLPSWG